MSFQLLGQQLLLDELAAEFLEAGQDGLVLRDGLLDGGQEELLVGVDLGGEVAELGSPEQLAVEVLAPVAVGTVPLKEVLLARLGLVVGVEVLLALQFVRPMGEGTSIPKLARTGRIPVLAHLRLQLPGVVLHELLFLLLSMEGLLLGLDIYLECGGVGSVVVADGVAGMEVLVALQLPLVHLAAVRSVGLGRERIGHVPAQVGGRVESRNHVRLLGMGSRLRCGGGGLIVFTTG